MELLPGGAGAGRPLNYGISMSGRELVGQFFTDLFQHYGISPPLA
jgi:hypothetical protein